MFVPLPPALPVQDQAALFVDVSEKALPGIITTCGSAEKEWILEVNGGGLALADFDGDADLDLVVVDGSTMERVGAGERAISGVRPRPGPPGGGFTFCEVSMVLGCPGNSFTKSGTIPEGSQPRRDCVR